MIRVLIFALLIACRCIGNGATIDDLKASQILASCHLHDYGELEIPPEHRDSLIAWAKDRGVSGFNSVGNQAATGSKAIALFDITAPDDDFFEISLIALKNFAANSSPESYLSAILMPTERKRGLLAIYYRDERLRTALEECLQRLAPESPLANLIKLTLDGEQAKSVIKHAGDGGYPARYGPLAKEALSGKVPTLSAGKSNGLPMNDASSQQSSNGAPPNFEGTQFTEFGSSKRWWPWLASALAIFAAVWMLKRRS
jgi:hypothetical protein